MCIYLLGARWAVKEPYKSLAPRAHHARCHSRVWHLQAPCPPWSWAIMGSHTSPAAQQQHCPWKTELGAHWHFQEGRGLASWQGQPWGRAGQQCLTATLLSRAWQCPWRSCRAHAAPPRAGHRACARRRRWKCCGAGTASPQAHFALQEARDTQLGLPRFLW